MQTAAATVNQMLQLVVSDRLRQLGEGDGVPNALVIFRDDHVSAVGPEHRWLRGRSVTGAGGPAPGVDGGDDTCAHAALEQE